MTADETRGLRRYGIAAAAVVAALGLTLLIRTLAPEVRFPIFLVATAGVGLYCGIGPALATIVASSVAAYLLLMPPGGTPDVVAKKFLALGIFALSGSMITALVGVRRRIDERRRAAEQEVMRLNLELARRVKELQTLLDLAPIGVAVAANPDCRVITLNRTFSRLVGSPEGANVSTVGRTPDELPFRLLQGGREL